MGVIQKVVFFEGAIQDVQRGNVFLSFIFARIPLEVKR